jgi:hypothetical protein
MTLEGSQALLFVNKRSRAAGAAKNFLDLAHCRLKPTAPDQKKFFAPLFFKKAAAFLI